MGRACFSLPIVAACLALFASAAVAQQRRAVAYGAQTAPVAEPTLRLAIRPGETLSTFSQTHLITSKVWPEIAKLNKLKNPHRVRVGQEIDVPVRYLRIEQQAATVLSATGDTSLKAGASLVRGQQVRTGPNSAAVIELADQTKVKLLPGTLAELVQNGTYAKPNPGKSVSSTWYSGAVRLVQGGLEVIAPKSNRIDELKVIMPTAIVGVRGTVFRAAVLGGDRAKTEVVEGSVNAENTAQKSAALVNAGFGAVIDPRFKEVKTLALLPAPDLSALPAELRRPAMAASFAALAGAVSYRVQIAKDAAFNEIVADLPSPTPSISFSGLADGNWHLRARGVDAQGLEGMDRAKPLTLLTPPPPPPPPAPPPPPRPVVAPIPTAEDVVMTAPLPTPSASR